MLNAAKTQVPIKDLPIGCSTVACNQPGQVSEITKMNNNLVFYSIPSRNGFVNFVCCKHAVYRLLLLLSHTSVDILHAPKQEILGHNEDALSETLNHWYLVSAHLLEPGYKEEKFTSLSYAGFLPGYTMGYNHHGLVYTINTLSAANLRTGKTRTYLRSDI